MWSVLYLCCLLLAGYAVVGLLGISLTRIEHFSLASVAGPAVFGFCLIFLSMLGVVPSRGEIILLGAIFAVLAIPAVKSARNHRVKLLPQHVPLWLLISCALVIAYGLYTVGTDAVVYPTLEWDAFAIWQLKAKVLAHAALYPRPAYFSDVRLSFSHLRYPLLWPMISAGAYAMNDSLVGDPGFGKLPAYLLYLGLGAAIFAVVERRNSRFSAIVAAGFAMTTPVIYRYGGSGTAEMALTAFYGCSVISILRWQENRRWGDLFLVALFSAAMAWTKNEGQALALINGLVLLIFSPAPFRLRNLAAVLCFALFVGLIFLLFLVYIHPLPRVDEDYAGHLKASAVFANLARLPQILRALGTEFITTQRWGIFWILVLFIGLLQFRQGMTRPIITLWCLLLLQFLSYLPPYMVTTWDLSELLPATTDRLLLHMMPTGALLVGLLWPTSRPVLTTDKPLIK